MRGKQIQQIRYGANQDLSQIDFSPVHWVPLTGTTLEASRQKQRRPETSE